MATAFLRQTLTNEEGGVDQEEYRVAACFDRTDTVGTVWLGLTIGCAQCHDHPSVDGYKQAEFYGIFAFLNRTYLFPAANRGKDAALAESHDRMAQHLAANRLMPDVTRVTLGARLTLAPGEERFAGAHAAAANALLTRAYRAPYTVPPLA